MKKKPSFHVFFGLLFSLLLFHFSASARFILSSQGNCEIRYDFLESVVFPVFAGRFLRSNLTDTDEKGVKAIDVANARSTTELDYDVQPVESDECDKEGEECSEGRMIVEAHLDYIYTQHHKPAYKHKP